MELVPALFIVFKGSVLAIGMFFAVKWHHDRAKEERGPASLRAVLWTAGKVIVSFALLLAALLFLTLRLGSMLGINLALP